MMPTDNYILSIFTYIVRCSCNEGYDGPQCELLDGGFSANGWSWFQHLPSCNDTLISFTFIPYHVSSGILFYNGPTGQPINGQVNRGKTSHHYNNSYIEFQSVHFDCKN